MKKNIFTSVVALLLAGAIFVPSVKAESLSVLEQIETLMAQLVELQEQLAQLQGDIREVLKDGLKEGATDKDIAKIQEILATDPTIYPEGLVTGYFGPLTKAALKRFQARHKIRISGELDTETRNWFESYLEEKYGGKIPAGLLRTPGIIKKIEYRYKNGCKDNYREVDLLCKKLKLKYYDDNKYGKKGFKIKIEIEDEETELEFKFDGKKYELNIDSVELDDILDLVADTINDDDVVFDLDKDFANAIKIAFDKEIEKNAYKTEEKTMDDAQEAIDDAQEDIDDAQDEIDDADAEGDDTTEAASKLQEATDKLAEARIAFDADNFEDAEDLAEDAEDLAEDAEDLAEDAEPATA